MERFVLKLDYLVFMKAVLLLVLPALCVGQFKSGVKDSVQGTIQLLNGINELLEAGRASATNPLGAIQESTVADGNGHIFDAATPKIEQLYDTFFNANSGTGDDVNATSSPSNADPGQSSPPIQTVEGDVGGSPSPTPRTTQGNFGGHSAPIPPAEESFPTEPTIEGSLGTSFFGGIPTANEETTVNNDHVHNSLGPVPVTEGDIQHLYNASATNSTFEYLMSVQDNVCYKLRDVIDNVSRSELVVLLMKFLKYDYLKAQGAWERLKVTSDRIWAAAITEERNQTYGSRKVTQVLSFVDKLKDEVKYSFNILKVPFSTVMRVVKNKFKRVYYGDAETKDFCMKLNDAERKLRETVIELEKKFSNRLDVKIKEQNKVLEAGRADPDKMVLLDKETIKKDISYLKDKVYTIYDYIRNAATKQLDKLKGLLDKKK